MFIEYVIKSTDLYFLEKYFSGIPEHSDDFEKDGLFHAIFKLIDL